MLLNVREVAELLGVSTASVYKLCSSAKLAHVRVSHAIRFRRSDLTAFIASRREAVKQRDSR